MSTKPLSGIRVLELGAYISGPYAGGILASLGADVVKVEPPRGDDFRRGVGISSPYFYQYNAGKRSIAIDLKRQEGVELVKAMLPKFDVVIENSRPGKTEALGLGYDVCKAINPRIVYSSISGFGDGGPWRDRAAYDSIGQSMGGFYSVMSDAGNPRLSGTCVGDLITAIVATMGILTGLVGRGLDPKGEGLSTQTSLLEAMSTITIDAMTQYHETGVTPTRESRHPQAQNFCLKTASGESITLHLSSSQKFWKSLTLAMGRPDLAEDERFATYYARMDNYFDLKVIVDEVFAQRPAAEWEERLVEFDVPFAPVQTMESLTTDPQTIWLEMLEPEVDGNVLVRPPWRFGGQRPQRDFRAPHVGEHTREIALQEFAADVVEDLISRGVLMQAEVGQGNVGVAS